MAESYQNRHKTLWEKEKLELQTRKNQGLFGKGLKTLWHKEKMLVTTLSYTSLVFLSLNVSLSFKDKTHHLCNICVRNKSLLLNISRA